MMEDFLERFTIKKLPKIIQTDFRTKTLTKKKGGKLYVKSKSHDNSFNDWIDKKDIVI